jgi:ribosome-interacting GTPase 1
MPVNAPPEYFKAQERYLKAKNLEEKIEALEDMIRFLPKHKGAENLLAQLKAKLSKLKAQQERISKGKRRVSTIKKEGDIMVAIIGNTNSGKTRLLNTLCNTSFEESYQPYTTKEPQVGVSDYGGAKIQFVEVPAFFRRQDLSIAHASDCVLLVAKEKSEIEELKEILRNFRVEKPVIEFLWDCEPEELKEKIWEISGYIRVYTKERDKPPEKKPIVVRKGATVKDVAERIHEDFVKYFKFAKVWGKSAKFPGEKVGLDHVLEDGDIVEIRIK